MDRSSSKTRSGRKVNYSVVVPFYNEAVLARKYYTELSAALQGLGESYQIVFVDDGSTDATAEILRMATEHDPCVDVIRLPRNVGQQQATLVGMREAAGDVVVTMDADLHVDPEHIAGLLQVLRDDPQCDVASGARTTRAAGVFRRITSHMVTTLLNRMCRTRLKDPGSTFRAMRRRVVERALRNEILAQNLPLFVTYSGLTIREVPVPSSAPPRRRSSYRPSSLLMALALAMLNYSSGARGLSVLLTVGGGMMLAGAALCTGLIVKGTIHQTPLPTNLLLAGLVAACSGMRSGRRSTGAAAGAGLGPDIRALISHGKKSVKIVSTGPHKVVSSNGLLMPG